MRKFVYTTKGPPKHDRQLVEMHALNEAEGDATMCHLSVVASQSTTSLLC